MAKITIAMRHSQGVTMQYIALPIAERATITTRLAIASYEDEMEQDKMEENEMKDEKEADGMEEDELGD